MTKNKNNYTLFTAKALLLLIIPIIIESALTMSVGMVDSLMVGGVDDKAIASVTQVDQMSNLIIQLFSAFGAGGAILTAQFLGAEDNENANKSAKQLVLMIVSISFVIMAICLLLHRQLISLFYGGLDEQSFSFCVQYFLVTACSYPFLGLFYSSAALLRAQRKSGFTMLTALIAFIGNVVFNYLFIYVFDMGIIGAATATLISRILQSVIMFAMLTKKSNIVRIKLRSSWKIDWSMIKRILTLGVPSGIESSLFQLGKLMTFGFVAISIYNVAISPDEVINYHSIANSIVLNLNSIGSIIGHGIGMACLTVVGQAVGAKREDQLNYYIKKMFIISYLSNALSVAIAWSLSPLLIGIYDVAPESADIAQKCCNFAFLVQIFTYPVSFTTPSILKATSDVKYVMFAAIISMITMRVGLCWLFTSNIFPFQLGAIGFWIAMCADWTMRGILFSSRLFSGKWKKRLTFVNTQPTT